MQLRRTALIVTFTLFAFCAYAQRTERVKAECTFYAPETVSIEEAKRTALDRAKIQAIANEFGTIVTQSNTTFVGNGEEGSTSQFFSLGGSDVKGEWIETIGEPEYSISYDRNMLVVKVSVTGRIREITSAAIDFKAKILCNGTEDKFESDRFRSGDDLYLSFTSPVSGYLAVYLVDMEQQAYCLLPYQNQTDGIYKVAANRPYLFFSASAADASERAFVDEYMMTCSGSAEQNIIYVIFSPNSFAKAADSSADGLPRTLPYADFQKWLAKCRKVDTSMNPRMFPISITK